VRTIDEAILDAPEEVEWIKVVGGRTAPPAIRFPLGIPRMDSLRGQVERRVSHAGGLLSGSRDIRSAVMPDQLPPDGVAADRASVPDWYAAVPSSGLPTTLGIEIVELSGERVVATMPVDERTRQPFGILHGGASIALAETVASFGATASIDRDRFIAVGQEINGNHLRPKTEGVVRATGVPVHVGRSTQVWSIEIADEQGRLVCISRCTMAIVERR
jgi:1,4-dihydroxy-2-naphthoyl-CoA hydrolase